VEGQSDMLACFLAQMLLTHPNLSARSDSLLAMHLHLLEQVCSDGLALLASPNRGPAEAMKLCLDLEARWSEFTLATQAIQEAVKTMAGVKDRVQLFLAETLSHRARGQPKTMLDAKEVREFMFYTSLNQEHLGAILGRDVVDMPGSLAKVEDMLRRHFRLLRDIFRHYCVQNPSHGSQGITLEGLLKIFQDCKLRSKELAPHHLEVIFNDHVQADSSKHNDERSLAPHEYIEVLLHCAHSKFKGTADYLPEQMSLLIENHLKPNACNDSESLFQKMAYSTKVRQVLDKHSAELKIIFQLYATLDMSSTEAMQRASTMNITEFQMLLEDTELLDETLTVDAVQQIFEGIQQSATAEAPAIEEEEEELEDDDDPEGLDDDDEMAFSEFVDGLIAVVAYKFPDPFTPLSSRINTFILQLYTSLRKHWSRKRISPLVDTMLNALQKKMR